MAEGRSRGARRRAARFDWSTTPLGPMESWPRALRVAWDVAVECPLPVALMCGPEFTMVYNDAFAGLLGGKHPAAFGRPASEVVAEVWHLPNVGPLFEAVRGQGESFLEEGNELVLQRGQGEGADPDTGYFLRAGSPVVDDDGSVLAVLHVVIETTSAIGRARAVASFATALAAALNIDDVCKVVLRHAMAALDATSAAVCLMPPDGTGWRMVQRHRIEDLSPGDARLPLIWSELTEDVSTVAAMVTAREAPYVSGTGDVVGLPLRAGSTDAALVVSRAAVAVPQDAVALLGAFTDLVGQALGRAVVHETERAAAELLQRTLLPAHLSQADELSVAARYEPASEHAVAGGDFYDSFFLPDGRLALVIGDVVGRGVLAATVMGQVRAAVRGSALTNSDPGSVMAVLDRVILDLDALRPSTMPLGGPRARPGVAFGGELFVTMLFGIADPATGAVELASAGHPLPVLLAGNLSRAGGSPRGQAVAMQVGPPLGLGGHRPVHHLELEVGDMLVAFTDGLLERRGEPLQEGEERLLRVLAQVPPGSPRSVANHLVDALVRGRRQEDDCAVLTVGRSPEGHRRATIVVPPMPESVRAVRGWASERLTAWGIGAADQQAVITGVSELVTNSILHAGTESHLTLDLDSGVLAVTVADSGQRGEPLVASAEALAVRGRGLSLVEAMSDAFGTHRTSAGTTVWFELAVSVIGAGARE